MNSHIKQPTINIFDLVLTNDTVILENSLVGWVVGKKRDVIDGSDIYIVEWQDGVRTDHSPRTIEILRDNVGKRLRGAHHLINIKT